MYAVRRITNTGNRLGGSQNVSRYAHFGRRPGAKREAGVMLLYQDLRNVPLRSGRFRGAAAQGVPEPIALGVEVALVVGVG